MGGRDALLEVLDSEGVRHVFGNPGTTELPLIDALAGRTDIEYVLALQEASVIGMADGYARATGRPSFVNLHTSAGLGNAIGNLTNAQANLSPIVVTAGQQDRRHLFTDPMLGGDLVGIAGPVVKWAHEARNLEELGTVLRRAFNDAAAPPPGPVFVSLPMDLLDADGEAPVPPKSGIDLRTTPPPDALQQLAKTLQDTSPADLVLVVGDDAAGAVEPLIRLAEALGCAVYAASLHSALVFPNGHPQFAGPLPPNAHGMADVLGRYRRVLAIGGHPFLAYPYTPGPAVPPGTELIHVSPDPYRLGRTHAAALALVGDPGATAEAIVSLLAPRPPVTVDKPDFEATALSRYDATPVHPMAASHALLRALPDDVAVVDEAITTGTYVRGLHRATTPRRYFFARGGGLGWGMPAAVGVSLALDKAPVLCVVGDGSAMYSPQALWTAANQRTPVVFAVVDNRQYLILKRNLKPDKNYTGLDLDDPPVDFVALAQSMGVPAQRVDSAHDIAGAVEAAVAADGPTLLEIPISS